ncbi:unnamed protein product [Pedinophyceae sp. YPF-701]|nr:unnamed protein product [Pedinophyceae sp. YPF-701]
MFPKFKIKKQDDAEQKAAPAAPAPPAQPATASPLKLKMPATVRPPAPAAARPTGLGKFKIGGGARPHFGGARPQQPRPTAKPKQAQQRPKGPRPTAPAAPRPAAGPFKFKMGGPVPPPRPQAGPAVTGPKKRKLDGSAPGAGPAKRPMIKVKGLPGQAGAGPSPIKIKVPATIKMPGQPPGPMLRPPLHPGVRPMGGPRPHMLGGAQKFTLPKNIPLGPNALGKVQGGIRKQVNRKGGKGPGQAARVSKGPMRPKGPRPPTPMGSGPAPTSLQKIKMPMGFTQKLKINSAALDAVKSQPTGGGSGSALARRAGSALSRRQAVAQRRMQRAQAATPQKSAGAAPAGPPLEPTRENMMGMVHKLRNMDKKGWFQEKITDDVAPGYSAVIDTPMYFDLMAERAEQEYYKTWDALLADVTLLYDNCMRFNSPKSEYFQLAGKLSDKSRDTIERVKEGRLTKLPLPKPAAPPQPRKTKGAGADAVIRASEAQAAAQAGPPTPRVPRPKAGTRVRAGGRGAARGRSRPPGRSRRGRCGARARGGPCATSPTRTSTTSTRWIRTWTMAWRGVRARRRSGGWARSRRARATRSARGPARRGPRRPRARARARARRRAVGVGSNQVAAGDAGAGGAPGRRAQQGQGAGEHREGGPGPAHRAERDPAGDAVDVLPAAAGAQREAGGTGGGEFGRRAAVPAQGPRGAACAGGAAAGEARARRWDVCQLDLAVRGRAGRARARAGRAARADGAGTCVPAGAGGGREAAAGAGRCRREAGGGWSERETGRGCGSRAASAGRAERGAAGGRCAAGGFDSVHSAGNAGAWGLGVGACAGADRPNGLDAAAAVNDDGARYALPAARLQRHAAAVAGCCAAACPEGREDDAAAGPAPGRPAPAVAGGAH